MQPITTVSLWFYSICLCILLFLSFLSLQHCLSTTSLTHTQSLSIWFRLCFANVLLFVYYFRFMLFKFHLNRWYPWDFMFLTIPTHVTQKSRMEAVLIRFLQLINTVSILIRDVTWNISLLTNITFIYNIYLRYECDWFDWFLRCTLAVL